MKKLLMSSLVIAASYGTVQAQDKAAVTALMGPASDSAADLNYTRLPKGFPVIGEMKHAVAPTSCGLSKVNRPLSNTETSLNDFSDLFVFASLASDKENDAPYYQIAVNGALRTVKESGRADTETQTVRYFKTIDTPTVEVMVAIEPSEDGTQKKGIFGRIKAWDADLPLMCGYNRIEVIGDCDL